MNILLVEDNESDVLLMEVALQKFAVSSTLRHCSDGEEATRYLDENAAPDIVLLDLNLPKKSGHEVLREIKAKPHFKALPVIIFSTTAHERDVKAATAYPATRFITKPSTFAGYEHVLRLMETLCAKSAQPAAV